MMDTYLIDANAFIEASRTYYAFSLIPAVWACFQTNITNGRIMLLDCVMKEIGNGKDDLSLFLLSSVPKDNILYHGKDPQCVQAYGNVMRYIHSSQQYKYAAMETWSKADYADPWLVAMASAKDYVLVTPEVASGLFVPGQPHKNIKIPEVSLHFNVRTINLFDMMKELHIVV